VASRRQEKERRRQERIAAERAARERGRRAQRMRMAGAGLLAVIVVAVVGVVIAGSGGKGGRTPSATASSGQAIPAPRITSLKAAAQTAGCRLQNFPKGYEDRAHTFAKVNYKTNPPAFGPHNPIPAQDGDYVGQGTPSSEHLVHALEHGRTEIQYRPGLPRHEVSQLETLFNQSPARVLLFQNATGMPYAVAAVTWTHILGCPRFTPRVFDAIRAFHKAYDMKAPETQYPGPE
jgi:hypothetical protein